MDNIEFLRTVLPPEGNGFYVAAELTTRSKEHAYVTTIEELCDKASAFADSGKDSYFALATYGTRGSRAAVNAAKIRCLFADIDIKHGSAQHYDSVAAALLALQQFSGATGLSKPFLVSSGYGVHAYWPFIEPVAVNDWVGVAEAFKACARANGLKIDYSVSADAARVLRVPGTYNRKSDEPRPVKLRVEGEALPFSKYEELLAAYRKKNEGREARIQGQHAVSRNSIADVSAGSSAFAAIEGIAPAFVGSAPGYYTEIADIAHVNFDNITALGDQGCLQIDHYIKNASNDGMEPLWRAVISVAKYCKDGHNKALALSAMHPYSVDRTEKKLADIRGPYNCESFDKINPGVCQNCKFYNKVTNPIALGKELKEQKPIEVEVKIGAHVVAQHLPDPPKGYIISERGVGVSYKEEGVPKVAYVTDTPIVANATYDRAGERYVQFTYTEHKQAKNAVIPLAVAVGKDDCIKEFAKIGVMVPIGQDAGFRAYIKATISEAKKNPPLPMPTSLGWQSDDSFAFDNRVFDALGDRVVPMFGFDNINDTIGCRGTLDGWRLVLAGVMRLERWDILSMALIGFASPLMRFTGLNGVTFHVCGNSSGLGKTLCQRLASSIWGVPDKFRVTPSTSPIAMVNRLGMLGNLPLMVDEITHKGRNENEWFPEFLSQMSDGRGKDRMESQKNIERRNTTAWSSIAFMTSNKHMLDYLTAEREHQSEGEIRRLVEITFDKELTLDHVSKSLFYDTLPENYGVAGEAYARWLVCNVEKVKTTVKQTYTELFNALNATGDERFWIAGCAAILASARLIGKKNAGIIDLPIGKIAGFLAETVENMRTETRRMRRTAMDVLNEFTKRNYGKLVMVTKLGIKINGAEIAETLDRRDLCGRVEKNDNGWISYYIEERELKAFCSAMSYGYAEFKRDIAKESPIEFIRKNLLLGTKGPDMVVRCIIIKQRSESEIAEQQSQKASA